MKTEENSQQQTGINETGSAQPSLTESVLKTSSKRIFRRYSRRIFSDVLSKLISGIFKK